MKTKVARHYGAVIRTGEFLRLYIEVHTVDKPAIYRIRVRGGVPVDWLDRLGGMQITIQTLEDVTLEGWLPDQAALCGVLDTLYCLHLPIVEVTRLKDP